MFDDIAVVIPVRLGSGRVERKVMLPFGESNLLDWKIKQLKKVISEKNIYVSTESDLLKEIATENNVQIHHRDFYLADGHKAKFTEVITGVVKDIPFEHIAWVTAVVPLMSPKEYKDAFQCYTEKVIESKVNDSLFSANLLKEYLWDAAGPINYEATKNHTISQNLPDIYRVTNGLYMRDKASIMNEGYFLGTNPYKFLVSKVAGVDIDVIEEYHMAQALLDLYKESEGV